MLYPYAFCGRVYFLCHFLVLLFLVHIVAGDLLVLKIYPIPLAVARWDWRPHTQICKEMILINKPSCSHLTLQDRAQIQCGLTEKKSLRLIAEEINKDPGTVSKEIRKRRVPSEKGSYGHFYNPCVHRKTCQATFVCSTCTNVHRKHCPACGECYKNCKNFSEEICPKLSKPPYCCNGCEQRQKCTLKKYLYDASTAQKAYEALRSESRKGIDSSAEELARIDAFVSPLLKQGQSIHHICESNRDVIMCSERTIYNHLKDGLLAAGPLDLPRMVRMRPRKRSSEKKVDRHCYEGRTYEDFLRFTTDHPDVPVVEMDSVIGRKGGKVLLTMFFRSSNLILAFLRNDNTARTVQEVIDWLYDSLGKDIYCNLFPVILTDRGGEFSNPTAIERDADDKLRSLVFYCDPGAPYQKGGIEVCHEMIRRILPKGSSFDDLQQQDIDLMSSHINSYKREKLNNRSPHQLSSLLYGEDVLSIFNLHEIPANDIILLPTLLKQ